MNDNLLEMALIIATKAHEGQTDIAGSPYIFHFIHVSTDTGQKKKSLHCYMT